MNENKCAGGYQLPSNGGPCRECGRTAQQACPRAKNPLAEELSRYRAFVGELKRWIQEQRVYGTTNPPKEVWKDKPFWLVAAELNDMLHDHIGEQE